MGLFTNRCVNTECGHRVRKGSEFCPKCGTPAPKGLTKCGSCGSEVSRQSKFCWRCGADLAAMAKPLLIGDRWVRHAEDFAVRVDGEDLEGWLSKPLIVEHGTRALLFQAGKFRGELREGRYDMGGFLKHLNHFMVNQAASVLLVEAGDTTIDLENSNLWTSDKLEVGAVERLVLRVADPDAMFVNLFKGRNRISLDDIEAQLADEIQMLLTGIVARYPGDQLTQDAGVRDLIEGQLRDTLAVTLKRLGLELVQVRFIRFVGEESEELRRTWGELRVQEEKVKINEARARLHQRLRETVTQDRMDKFKNEKDFEAFVRQTEHELGLGQVIREDEMARLRERFQFERSRDSLLRRIQLEGIENDDRREQAWQELVADEDQRDEHHRRELQRTLSEAKSEVEVTQARVELRKIEHAQEMREQELEHVQDMREASDGVGILERMQEVEQAALDREQQREAAALKARSQATVEALLSIVDGPAADRIVQMERLRAQQSMSPEQMLALAADASPAAAQALAKKYEADGQLSADKAALLEKQLAQQREMSDGYAERMERLMQTALSQMGGVATAGATTPDPKQTVVVPGGGGAPIVVNPLSAAGTCRHCGAVLEAGGGFCPRCGKKQ